MIHHATKRTFATLSALAALLSCASAPVWADEGSEESGIERATTSAVAGIKVPDNTFRSTGKGDNAKFRDALQKIAETNHGRIGEAETLIWQTKSAMKEIPERLKAAGYTYTTRPSFRSDGAHVTPLAAVRKDKKGDILGMWLEKDDLVLLAWAQYKAGNAGKTGETGDGAQSDRPAADSAPPAARGGRVPADLVGAWSWTTISGTNYVNSTTGQMMEPSGMSAKFTFTKDGKYTKFFYIHQRTYSLVTESTTTEEGMVICKGDGVLTLKPSRGHYAGHTGTRPIDRDMTESERKATDWFFEWRTVDGKRTLFLGPSKSALSQFKPTK